MGNTLKFVSGIILIVIGVLLAYEATIYNLINVLLMVGFFIAVVGVILIISYFIDNNTEKTTGLIKDFFDSADINTPSINLSNRNYSRDFDNNGPLVMRDESTNADYGKNIDDSGLWEYYESEQNTSPTPRQYFSSPEVDESKAVLNVVNRKENETNLDNQLNFTPNYEKPIKVSRKPKRRTSNYFYDENPQFEESTDKSEQIRNALLQDNGDEIIVEHDNNPRDIEIDINNPERLPVPKDLNSNILLDGNLITSKDAFEKLSVNVTKEIMLEIPSLNVLSDRFLSHVPTIYSRLIIDEFDLSDISYTVLIASLLKQGVHIKTVPKVHTTNLITDDDYAMIISDAKDVSESEYGAIYDDRISISNIRADFEKTWNIASNLDETVILNSIAGGNA